MLIGDFSKKKHILTPDDIAASLDTGLSFLKNTEDVRDTFGKRRQDRGFIKCIGWDVYVCLKLIPPGTMNAIFSFFFIRQRDTFMGSFIFYERF